jgi:hypothetical protein
MKNLNATKLLDCITFACIFGSKINDENDENDENKTRNYLILN